MADGDELDDLPLAITLLAHRERDLESNRIDHVS